LVRPSEFKVDLIRSAATPAVAGEQLVVHSNALQSPAMGSLDGKIALITGAARGQGRSHALALAAEGADIVAWDAPPPMSSSTYPLGTQEDLDLTAKLVAEKGRRCLSMSVDVRDSSQVNAGVARAMDEFGRLDIARANAGIVSIAPLVDVTDEAWEELVATNLTGVFTTLRAVVPPMLAQGWGRIVVTSSMGGRMGIKGQSAYNATKWGVIGLAKSLALEVANDGITVNVVCPCTVLTPMVQPDPDREVPEEFERQMTRGNPIAKPWIEAADVTRAVMYLVQDPGVLTGTIMEVSLGSSARMS
jgi:SDR family mycofactocin-dependent oxidoreductase